MSFPPLHSASQNFNTSGAQNTTSAGSARPRQSAWGLPAQVAGSRRGLTPLSTNVPSSSIDPTTGRPSSSSSPSLNPTTAASPFASTFSSVLNSSSRLSSSRTASSASPSASPFTPLQTGSQQVYSSQLLSSPRSRATTPFPTSNLVPSAAASTTAIQGGGGGSSGGGGTSRSTTYSPSLAQQGLSSPTSSSFDRNILSSSVLASGSSGQSSVSKIVVTQVFLLLGSITEKEGKAKWDSQAEAIRKLVDSHGIEIFAKYFRRLLVGNSPQIFPGINRNVENPGNYQLLVQEIEKASQDTEQAKKIAEIIDTSEGDIFRDFDLAVFLNHFKLNPVPKTILASAFTGIARPDLRTKAGSILSSNYQPMLQSFANLHNNEPNIPPALLATAALCFLRNLPESSKEGSEKSQVYLALLSRYSNQDLPMPVVVRSAMALNDLFDENFDLAKELQKQGPQVIATVDTAKDFLTRYGKSNINEDQVAGALLFMVLTPDSVHYHPDTFVTAVREVAKGLSWQKVVRSFDRESLTVSPEQFLTLYNCMLPITQDNPQLDIQSLWGGQWKYRLTQLSFALALISLSSVQLDAASIPGLRSAYDPRECLDGPEEVVDFAQEAMRDTMISLDAVTAISEIVFNTENPISREDATYAQQVISAKTASFVCSAAGIPKPWSADHQNLMSRMLIPYLLKQQPNHRYVLHSLWKQDKHWLATRLIETHLEDPIKLPILLDHAEEHGWLDDLSTLVNGFGIDLAALAHRRGIVDLDQWASEKLARAPEEFSVALSKFLIIKAQDEMRTTRGEQSAPRTVSLAMKTVYGMLKILEEHMKDRRDELVALERQCMQAFPRLINYGEGFDDAIEANGAESNSLSQSTDAEMQDLYKRMYSTELEVRNIIEALQDCKTSSVPAKQDLFCCMIHGLFDEYVCFNEYPLGPLATTAVLFGGIISYRLITGLTLNVGLEMVLEAVRDYNPESSMYKFGLQALLHFLNRLPEWSEVCQQLVQISGLQGTEAYVRAEEVLRQERGEGNKAAPTDGTNGHADGNHMTNGNLDDYSATDAVTRRFQSVHTDPLPNPGMYADPDEEIQDKVLFVLNNVSKDNLDAKIVDLIEVLKPKHHHWFAEYLVEQRAKMQPNYQSLYLRMLDKLGESDLWINVLRETYVSVEKMLNSEATVSLVQERAYLRNLAYWLGSLTLARNKPIKHKNIDFKELLLEGWETQRLIVVVPFTCKVLGEGKNSVVFKPPNPWVMEIVSLLLEFYDLPSSEMKIQLRFDIEVLIRDLGLPSKGKGIERSNELKKRQEAYEEEMAGPSMDNLLDGFEDPTLGGLNKGVRNARFSPTTIASSLPDLDPLLVFPPSSGSPANQNRLRQIVQNAVQRAILEIIGPVVERSVTIATIATKDLIHKDYAQEPDEERVREASQQMAKALSGSLALVTCKEPLRMSMTNYIRLAASEVPDQAFPEGAILMCVNDNLDTACSLVEKQAEERSLPEIDAHIDAEIAKRRQFKADYPNEPYRDPVHSVWSSYIPEPYKQGPGGLNQDQLDIYLQFARQIRGTTNHTQNLSTDSGKQQIPDVLQDVAYPGMQNLPTPAEAPAIPMQPTQQQQQQPQQGRMAPQSIPAPRLQTQVNGYVDPGTLQDHIHELLSKVSQLASETPDTHYRDLPRDSPAVVIVGRIETLIMSAAQGPDPAAYFTASLIYPAMYREGVTHFELEVLAQIMRKVSQLSGSTAKDVILLLRNQDEERVFDAKITGALLEVGLMEFAYVDMVVARAIRARKITALKCLTQLLQDLLFTKYPVALRADFANSLGRVGEWFSQEPDLPEAEFLIVRLRDAGIPETIENVSDQPAVAKRHEMQYIFVEWVTLCRQPMPTDNMFVAFITELHSQQLLNSQEEMVLFLRICVDLAAEPIEREDLNAAADPNEVFFDVDALAKLIVLLVKNQGESIGSVQGNKAAYMNSILSLLVLILNNHHVMRGEQFNQRLFFRLFSSTFYYWHDLARGRNAQEDREMILVFAGILLLLDPHYFPAFTYGWLSLVSHRAFMPAVLKLSDNEGSEPFAKIMELMLSYVSNLLKPGVLATIAKELYRGVLRVLLILHHDFPEFLAENHYRLCNTIPTHCTQLRNLVLSAYPSSILELPNPLTAGLKVDRLEEIRKAPGIAGDIIAPLQRARIKDVVDRTLQGNTISDENINTIASAIQSSASPGSPDPNPTLLHALVLYIGQTVLSIPTTKAGPTFDPSSPQATLLTKLARELEPTARYHFLNAIANQLRYPNSHTHFYSYALLHLFGADHADQLESDVRQQITRVLLERLIVHRPHPWGLIITLLELLKNPAYCFTELPFIKAAPEVEKLFGVLFQHINQNPRALV